MKIINRVFIYNKDGYNKNGVNEKGFTSAKGNYGFFNIERRATIKAYQIHIEL